MLERSSGFGAALVAVLLLTLGPAGARADRTVTVTADSLVFSQPVSLVWILQSGAGGRTWGAFESDAQILVHSVRPDATGEWELLDPKQYYCPELAMVAGQRWRFLDDEDGATRTAEVITLENVTVPAGDFLAWRVDVSRDDQPGAVVLRLWFAGNVGPVREVEFEGGVRVSRLDLQSYSVDGPGFFPLRVGNAWQYGTVPVEVRDRSLGQLKAHHVR